MSHALPCGRRSRLSQAGATMGLGKQLSCAGSRGGHRVMAVWLAPQTSPQHLPTHSLVLGPKRSICVPFLAGMGVAANVFLV